MPGKLLSKVLLSLVLRQAKKWEAEFLRDCHSPQAVQEALLQRILARQAATDFGKKHSFASIKNLSDYRKHVPILRYEEMDPYIAEVRKGKHTALLSDPVIHMFALTSGTTATRKFIPVTRDYLHNYRKGMTIWGKRFFDAHPEGYLKPILQLVGDWDEFRSDSGIPCGSVSGLTAQMQKKVVHWMYCMPAATGKIKDSAAKHYVAARLSLIHPELGMISTANPSSMTQLALRMNEEKEHLIRDIHDGTLNSKLAIDSNIREKLKPKIKAHPQRAKQLEEIVARTGTLYPKDAWNKVHAIGCWTGGSVGLYLKQFSEYYHPSWPIRDLGLLASEGRFTIPVEDGTPGGVLDISSHFFEFIPVGEIDSQSPTTLTAWELEEGKEYFLLPTTSYGLYRYNIYDVVKVVGKFQKTPIIAFLNKGSSFSSLTGEKLSEHQIVESIRKTGESTGFVPSAYTVAACWEEPQPFYGLFIEEQELARTEAARWLIKLETMLQQINIEYEAKRSSGRLGPIQLLSLKPGTWRTWDIERLKKTGGTAEQYKRPCLISDTSFREQMKGHYS